MKKEYDLKNMKVKKRGPLISGTTKVMKTIRLDVELVRWLLKEASIRGVGYQTLINMFLTEMRNSITSQNSLREEIRAIVQEELKKAS